MPKVDLPVDDIRHATLPKAEGPINLADFEGASASLSAPNNIGHIKKSNVVRSRQDGGTVTRPAECFLSELFGTLFGCDERPPTKNKNISSPTGKMRVRDGKPVSYKTKKRG